MNYEMMIDPFDFDDFKNMKPKQAQQYFDWFMSEIPHRMEVLQGFINKNKYDFKLDYTVESLNSIWKLLEENMKFDEFSKEDYKSEISQYPDWVRPYIKETHINSETMWMGIDIAIYYGEVFCRNNEEIKWDFVTKPKNYISVNKPVLAGFVGNQHIDPLLAIRGMLWKSEEKKDSMRLLEAYKWAEENMIVKVR